MTETLRIGLLINPVAGLGGQTALTGSDGRSVQALGRALGGEPRGLARAQRLLTQCEVELNNRARPPGVLVWRVWGSSMGADAFVGSAWQPEVIGVPATPTSARDTREAARGLVECGVDLLLFVGGDGTARDLFSADPAAQLCLGIPAGVKMHSGVFATTPETAAQIIVGLCCGEFVASAEGEIIDLDESARRSGELRTSCYGSLQLPVAGGFVQRTKEAGRENEALAVEEITAAVVEAAQGQLVIGPGSTCQRIKEALGLEATLLGVDVWREGMQQGKNVDSQWLVRYAPTPDRLILGFIRRQGFLFGRGNLQFSARWLAGVARERIQVVATRSKLRALAGAPFLIDTDDVALNSRLLGLYPVTVGYQDTLLYRAATHG